MQANDLLLGLFRVLSGSWEFLVESSPTLLLGFIAAGVLHVFVSASFVAAHLGRGRYLPVLKAAVLGMPLPLCSCGVLPAAMGLRNKGATKGATISFLVSTPENGADSIAITYALMGPAMAVARPLSALFSAIAAGLAESAFEKPQKPKSLGFAGAEAGVKEKLSVRLRHGFEYAFGDQLRDLTPWLAAGILLAGMISALVPDGWVGANVGTGWGGRIAAFLIGIPMYVCATASTPIAAALMYKGLSPGAAMILLLTGPATNAASLLPMKKMLGTETTVRYLASITVVTLLLGWLVDLAFAGLGLGVTLGDATVAIERHGWLEYGSVALIVLLAARAYFFRPKCGACCGV